MWLSSRLWLSSLWGSSVSSAPGRRGRGRRAGAWMPFPRIGCQVRPQRDRVDEERHALAAECADPQHCRARLGRRREADRVAMPARATRDEARARAGRPRRSKGVASRVVKADRQLQVPLALDPGHERVARRRQHRDAAPAGVIRRTTRGGAAGHARLQRPGARPRSPFGRRDTRPGPEPVPAPDRRLEAQLNRMGGHEPAEVGWARSRRRRAAGRRRPECRGGEAGEEET